MKIKIERFGPIREFTYDLDKDLIITYGNNNIGKSYAMQIVYLLLKAFSGDLYEQRQFYIELLFSRHIVSNFRDKKLEGLLQDFMKAGESVKDISDIINMEVYEGLGDMLLPDFMNSCHNTFGNFERTLEQTPLIHVRHNEFAFVINLKLKKIEGTIDSEGIRLKKADSDFHKSGNERDYFDICVAEDIESSIAILYEQVQKRLATCVESIAALFDGIHFLPASRSGIYSGMNAFGAIVAELSKNRTYFTKKIEFPGISEPISDYFISLSNIKSGINEELRSYFTQIEDEVLKGKVIFDKGKNALLYKPQNMEANFEMTEVSSMVSEISPIVAFLKYILGSQKKQEKRGKSILFIEEPEAHLHPNNQIALMEIFAGLIYADVKLIMSSHSNYVFNKLNNLILGGVLDYNVYQPIVLVDSESGSTSKILQMDELGADDENFIDVSEKLYEEREEIIQRLNMEE